MQHFLIAFMSGNRAENARNRLLPVILLLGLVLGWQHDCSAELPGDTYFSLAVTENSHNHYGHNLLFLHFQETADLSRLDGRTVISPRVGNGSVTVDGDLKEWNPAWFTRVNGRVMNNYPLSEFYDATPGSIEIASAFDNENIYFALRFEDANRDASINKNRWIFNGTRWEKAVHTQPRPGTLAHRAVNRDDAIAGNEDEDRVFFMFPIVDRQGNFRDGGMGCGGYCHPNLVESADPAQQIIGEGVATMHTALPGDTADVWHWTSTRSAMGDTLKDGFITFGEGNTDGLKADAGTPPHMDNDRKSLKQGEESEPAYLSSENYRAGNYAKEGFSTLAINKEDWMPIDATMKFAKGVSLPYYIKQQASGSRSDVMVGAKFDAQSGYWTLELKRALSIGDANDRDFIKAVAMPAPTSTPLQPGDPQRGGQLYKDLCQSCHGENGEGEFKAGAWVTPRNQRTSGPLILKTASTERIKRLDAIAGRTHPKRLMSFVPLQAQEAEDIASWLQGRFLPLP